jgi:hypothetical protein
LTAPPPDFTHLDRITDERGTFEHAEHTTPRRHHGYCTDDVARVLVVASRERDPSPTVSRLSAVALRFVGDAQAPDGACHNRMDQHGRWEDTPSVNDWWGRGLWGLGTAAARNPHTATRQRALAHFELGAGQRTTWTRSMAFGALGAAEVATAHPGHPAALALLADAVEVIGPRSDDPGWPWPEPRLAYANAVLPEVMIAAGTALSRPELEEDGLVLLRWLLDHETQDGHLSVTPVGGRGPDDHPPAFDQQPIEVAALADACVRAAARTGDEVWSQGLDRAVAWFLGDNDVGAPLLDPATGGGYDGLEPDGPNLNEGAESSLALLSTLQHARDRALVAS